MGNLLSIVITNKDHGHFLPRQLESIGSQTVSFDEVILIDDGSSDNSKEVMRNFKTNNPEINVSLFLHEENVGAVKRYDEGLRVSTSKFVYFAASDDYLLPDFVSEYKKVIESSGPSVKLIASAYFSRGGFFTPKEFADGDFNYIPGYGSIIDRKTLIEFGGHNPKLEFHHDWFFSLAIAFTHGFFAIPRELSVFSNREDSYCHTKYPKEKSFEILSEMIRVLNEEEAYGVCKDMMIDRCNSHMEEYINQDPKNIAKAASASPDAAKHSDPLLDSLRDQVVLAEQNTEPPTVLAGENNVSIGIIITNYNDGGCLPVQLDSIASQEVLPDELILIDDGSTDNSKHVMLQFRNDHPEINVKILMHNGNAGVVRRCNQGLYASSSKYLFFTGSDDFIYPTFIKEHKMALQESPVGEGCHCEDCKHKNYAQFKISCSANFRYRKFITAQQVELSNYASIPGHCTCVDREILIEMGGFNPILEAQCDWFAHMMSAHKYGFYSIPTMLSGVQHIAKGKTSSYATEFKETKENIYIAKEMVRMIRQEENKSFSLKMLTMCMDRFRFSPDWLRVMVDAYLEERQLRISERPEEE